MIRLFVCEDIVVIGSVREPDTESGSTYFCLGLEPAKFWVNRASLNLGLYFEKGVKTNSNSVIMN